MKKQVAVQYDLFLFNISLSHTHHPNINLSPGPEISIACYSSNQKNILGPKSAS